MAQAVESGFWRPEVGHAREDFAQRQFLLDSVRPSPRAGAQAPLDGQHNSLRALAHALLLGYLCGERGDASFRTPWAKLTDAPEHILRAQAEQACPGYLEYRHGGGATEVTFSHLLSEGGAT